MTEGAPPPRFQKDDWVRHVRTGVDGRIREVLWHDAHLGWKYLVALSGLREVPVQLQEYEIAPFYQEPEKKK